MARQASVSPYSTRLSLLAFWLLLLFLMVAALHQASKQEKLRKRGIGLARRLHR